ncbi:50S ribosomal protein L7/L12 [Geotalea uraniireducens]|uniref:50S ribosomal protein L7/L12 n=1 Tax=Geotalea uraniireducens TaxID=351604 RepID=A0ABN6VUK8_9BACT|nr:50S ribosomal protein L7/L12 [Geotalea uraniireducens]
MPRQEPQRTCLGCRQERNKTELLRFVLAPDSSVVPDILGKLPGRGAYTCFSDRCVRAAITRKQFNRAFRGEVRVDGADVVIDQVLARLEERIASYLALANKAGKVVSGSDTVLENLRRQKRIGLVLLASDISEDIGAKIAQQASRSGIPLFRLLDKERIGTLLGKSLRSVIAIEDGGFVPSIVSVLKHYGNFLDGGAVDEQDPRI